ASQPRRDAYRSARLGGALPGRGAGVVMAAAEPVTAQAPCTVVVLQPGYLPWLGFFDQMRRSDVFVHYDDVQFDKHGWRNRNRIKSPTGEPHWLTVPVRHSGLGTPPILDVEIDRRSPWARKHVGPLRQFYGAARSPRRCLPY